MCILHGCKMIKLVGDDLYYKNVFIASINSKLVPSFKDEVKEMIKNNFYTDDEIEEMKRNAKDETET